MNTTHQERWREWPCETAATIAGDPCKTVLSPASFIRKMRMLYV